MIKLDKVVNKIEKITGKKSYDYAFVMGSGLSNAMPELKNKIIFTYKNIGLGDSAVKGHSGKLEIGELNGKNVILFTRFHYYESGKMSKVFLPYELVKKLGAKTVVMTTATGGVNKEYNAGDVMVIKDHINLTGCNPLIGLLPIDFVDVREAYDIELINKVLDFSKKTKLGLKYGVHLQFSGPSYETPAEVEMARLLGADTVSMSTALDIIICAKLGLKVFAVAMVSNKAVDYNSVPLLHEEVLKIGEISSIKIQKIIEYILSV